MAPLNSVIKELEVTYKKGSEVTMTLAEVLIEEGIEKGKKESLSDMAINRLSRKFGIMPAEYQKKIAELDLKMLELLNYEIDNFKNIEDVKKFLALQLKLVLAWAELRQEELLADWVLAMNSELPYNIDPLK
jgi:hypothetical protein